MEVFYAAFIQKNALFPPPELTDKDAASRQPDMERILKMEAMMEGIEHRTRHKALGDGSEEQGGN